MSALVHVGGPPLAPALMTLTALNGMQTAIVSIEAAKGHRKRIYYHVPAASLFVQHVSEKTSKYITKDGELFLADLATTCQARAAQLRGVIILGKQLGTDNPICLGKTVPLLVAVGVTILRVA